MVGTPGVAGFRGIEAVLALAIFVWRLADPAPVGFWRDAVAVMALYWLLSALRGRSEVGALPAILCASYLLALQVAASLPRVLGLLGTLR